MRRLLRAIWRGAASRAVPPAVIGGFSLLYVGIAFGSNEPLTTLMALTRGSVVLLVLLALIPLNSAARICRETGRFLARKKAGAGSGGLELTGLFDEEVRLPEGVCFSGEAERLATLGYATRRTENSLAAWRGIGLFPARLLFLLGSLCLFSGILLSLTTRVTHREAVVQGEPLPGSGDLVRRIVLKEEPGLFLERSLDIEVALEQGGTRHFGLYPPSRHRGFFLYPRYLGIAPLVRFTAPDLPGGFERFVILSVYPPGKEDSAQIPGSPYRIFFQIAPEPGPDPFISGRMTLQFRLLKGDEPVFSGSAPIGGEAGRDGYRLAFPEFSRVVITDFVQDPGVLPIWSAGMLLALAFAFWLPVRLWFPRQEMLFLKVPGGGAACSFAEGGRRAHAGRYHELLDLLQPGERRAESAGLADTSGKP